VGIENNALGTVTVRESGVLALLSQDGMNVGGYQNNGQGVLNIEGGRVDAGAGVTLCRSTSSKGGVGTLNLSAGELGSMGQSAGYGLVLGRADNAVGVARAYATVSGGLLDISRDLWNSSSSQQGIVVGTASALGGASWGELRVSGGTVTNSGQFLVGAGLGGTGFVYQTGGAVRQGVGRPGVTCYQTTIGWGGGCGSYALSGGTFESAKPVYIGGNTATDLGYTPALATYTNNSVGTLRVDGGSFIVNGQNLYLGRYGSGTLVIGTNGFCSAKDIVLSNNMQSTLRFELGLNGPGTLTASGTLAVSAGAKLEVDSTAYRGYAIWFKLVDCATRTTAFAPANITVTGPGIVLQDRNEDIWLFIRRGTMLLLNN
jgi:T5SS/PEP-CTERM-associated repeat protein